MKTPGRPKYVQDDLLLTALLDVHVLHGEQAAEDAFHLGEVQPARLVLQWGEDIKMSSTRGIRPSSELTKWCERTTTNDHLV